MKFKLPNAVTTRVAMTNVAIKHNSPHILFGVGIALMAGTVVSACSATLKLEEVLDTHRDGVRWAKDNDGRVDARKEIAVTYALTARKLTVLYGPAFLLGAGSIVCLTQSHRIMTRRNVALTASYAAIDKAFKEYRNRVAREIGEDREREIFRAVETTTEKDANGKKIEVKRATEGGGSGYSRLFDSSNINWDTNGDYRVGFIRLQQNWCNDQLNAKGVFFLNEVYDALGMPRTEAGQYVGWVSKKYNESKDGYIDFGVFRDDNAEAYYNFAVHGEAIWLDFNVDGVVADLLKKI